MSISVRISQLKKTASLGAITSSVLKHSFRVITCYSAMALVSLAMPTGVKADPPSGTTNWTKSFEDTFSNSFDSNKWIKTFWWGDGNISDGSIDYYAPENVSVSNGYLTLKANNNSENGKSYTGAVVQTFGKFYQTYGYFEARVKVPKGGGLGPYFSLSPEDKSWPPEVNIFEIPGAAGKNATTVWMTNHYIDGSGKVSIDNSEGTWTSSTGLDQDYHIYGVLWQPGLLAWYVDGVERYRTTAGVPNKDCYMVLGLAVASDNGSWNGNPSNTSFPQYMSVNWVRAWQQGSGNNSAPPPQNNPAPAPQNNPPDSSQVINSGDAINLATSNGNYVSATGAGTVNAVSTTASTNQTFKISEADGSSHSINSGDTVNLAASNGNYVVAEGNGGGAVNANRTTAGPWEKFKITKADGTSGAIHAGDTINLAAGNGNYVVAEGNGTGAVNANRQVAGPWEAFKISEGN